MAAAASAAMARTRGDEVARVEDVILPVSVKGDRRECPLMPLSGRSP